MHRSIAVLLLLASAVCAEARVDVRLDPLPFTGRVIVELDRARPAAATFAQLRQDVSALHRRAGKRAIDPVRYHYRHAMFGAALEVSQESVEAIRRLPYVRAVHPDLPVRAYAVQPAAADAAARVNAVLLPSRGRGMVVAVIDSGIDYRHEALGGGFGPGFKVADGWDFVYADPDPSDDHGHGTHVAGIIAGDSAELTGVAPEATLYAYKVLNGMGAGLHSDIIAAIERSIDPNQDGDAADRVDVINLSLGGPGHAGDPVARAVDRATAAGITVVVAAGNEGRFSSIGSPGVALTAITVGAVTDAGAVTNFSSQGPGPVLLTFKPDVVAPGYQVLSARNGGGLIRMSGTSMASPYVAGVAALLLDLHPDWTPADVRSALVTTAIPSAAAVTARGAGFIDAARASAVTTFLDSSALSFGLAPGTTGFSELRQVVKVTNRGTVARTYDLAGANSPAGARLTATPARLELAPGASRAVELTLRIDNAALGFPAQPVLSGAVLFGGEEPFELPWMVMRAARLTVTNELVSTHVIAVSADGTTSAATYDWFNAELFGRPGTTWDIFSPGAEPGGELGNNYRIAIALDHPVTGDTRVAFSATAASAELVLDVQDETGRPMGDVERERGGTTRWLTMAFEHDKGELLQFHLGSWEKIFVSPMPWTLHLLHASWDEARQRVYSIPHRPLAGVTKSQTLTVRPADYLHTAVRFDVEGPGPYLMMYCPANGVRRGGTLIVEKPMEGCLGGFVPRPPRIDYYATRESESAASGIGLYLLGATYVPTLRAVDGGLVASDYDVSPADYRIADGEEIAVGATSLFPMAFHGTTGSVLHRWVTAGFYGPAGEWSPGATQGTSWTLYDADDVERHAGLVQPMAGPGGLPGGRLLAVREGLRIGRTPARAELEVRFGSDPADLVAPTLTSMRVENTQGRIAAEIPRNSALALRFSAADVDHRLNLQSQPIRSEATRVWYRRSAVGAWLPLPVVSQGSDDGSFATLSRVPAGELYRADLSAATAAGGTVDLRIEVEDARGNRMSWTQSPAFVVTGDPKRRSVR